MVGQGTDQALNGPRLMAQFVAPSSIPAIGLSRPLAEEVLGRLRQVLGRVVEVENAGEAVEHSERIHATPDLALAVGQHHPVLVATLLQGPSRLVHQTRDQGFHFCLRHTRGIAHVEALGFLRLGIQRRQVGGDHAHPRFFPSGGGAFGFAVYRSFGGPSALGCRFPQGHGNPVPTDHQGVTCRIQRCCFLQGQLELIRVVLGILADAGQQLLYRRA